MEKSTRTTKAVLAALFEGGLIQDVANAVQPTARRG
jgi:hypothetical protein